MRCLNCSNIQKYLNLEINMSFNTQLFITWAQPWTERSPQIAAEREQLIATMVAEGKTDGVPIILSDTIVQRLFIDEAAANEYVTWLNTAYPAAGFPGPASTRVINLPAAA